MTNSIKINPFAEEITMTKATAKKASLVGTKEYQQLVQATKDFPNYTIRIASPKGRETSDKGLTMEVMQKIIREVDNKEAFAKFETIRKGCKGTKSHFTKPKAYFLSEYPNWREWLSEVEEQQAAQA